MKSKFMPSDTYARLEREWLDVREPGNLNKDGGTSSRPATADRPQAA